MADRAHEKGGVAPAFPVSLQLRCDQKPTAARSCDAGTAPLPLLLLATSVLPPSTQ
jgi:hypothetical protein